MKFDNEHPMIGHIQDLITQRLGDSRSPDLFHVGYVELLIFVNQLKDELALALVCPRCGYRLSAHEETVNYFRCDNPMCPSYLVNADAIRDGDEERIRPKIVALDEAENMRKIIDYDLNVVKLRQAMQSDLKISHPKQSRKWLKMRKTKIDHLCAGCTKPIKRGDRVMRVKWHYGPNGWYYYVCTTCVQEHNATPTVAE